MSPRKQKRTKVFISYSRKDVDWLNRLRVHLKPLERAFKIDIWDDKKIDPGSKWKKEIEAALGTTKVAVLLISADFLASDFIATDELPKLLDAAEKEGAIILPVILSPSRFSKTESLAQFQAVNDPSVPLIDMTKGQQEAVLVEVAEKIEAALGRSKSAEQQIAQSSRSTKSKPRTRSLTSAAPKVQVGQEASSSRQVFLQPQDIRARLHNLRVAKTRGEILSDVKTFLNEVVYPERKIRVAFAERVEEGNSTVLRTEHLFPPKATHNTFSYPQTLAAWALIEGQILAFSPDIELLNRKCDFSLLRRLKKFTRVRELLLATNPVVDPLLSDYLEPEKIKRRTLEETLSLGDLYQHWVGRQPEPHYRQFVSVPVPVVDEIVGHKEPPEYGVLNIDTLETEHLLTEQTKPLLKLASDIIALGFEILQKSSGEAKKDATA
jgi:hypothetical protein